MWLLGGGKGRRVARNGVEGVQGRNSGSVVGDRASGRICREIRAFARYQGQGDPARQIPCPIERGGYLAQQSEGCLALWTPGEFDRQMAVMQERAESGRANRNRARLWASSFHEVEIDRQGRMAIPSYLRAFAGLENEVLVHGAIDRVGLWNPPRGPSGCFRRRAGFSMATTKQMQRSDGKNIPESTTAADACWTMCSSSTGVAEDHSTLFPGEAGTHPSLLHPVGGLQMVQSFEHVPVMRDEVVALFAPRTRWRPRRCHAWWRRSQRGAVAAHAGLRSSGSTATPMLSLQPLSVLLGSAIGSPGAGRVLGPPDVTAGPLSGVLFDLGVSSPQLDHAERGFSYRVDAPIDMRMDPTTAGPAQLVNELPEGALAELFRENGEGRMSGRIARAIVRARPLTSTIQLADVVSSAVPAAIRRRGHPAKRVFQALRIAVNDELGELATALPVAVERLAVDGRCAVISYHSGEDRLTKQIFNQASTGGAPAPRPCPASAAPYHDTNWCSEERGTRARPRSPPIAEPAAPGCGLSPGRWLPDGGHVLRCGASGRRSSSPE